MQASVIVFPGSNRERDIARALEAATGIRPHIVWHGDTALPKSDLIVLPGGFSYGDYLRSGAIAAHSPIMRAVKEEAKRGVAVLGVCNGFQTLVESGLLPGALMRNARLKFQCRIVPLKVERADTMFTRRYEAGQIIHIPIAHADGNYSADAETVKRLEGEGQIAFRYCTDANGSVANIAGVYDQSRRVLGMMPHFEDAVEAIHANTDGAALFQSLAA